MFYGAHDDDLCDLLLSHLFDGEKTYAPRGGWISCQVSPRMFYGVHDDDLCDLLLSLFVDGEKLCPQRWLDQLPGEPDRDSSWRQDGGRLSHSSGSAD